MKHIEKRISKLEIATPDKDVLSYGELLKRESTPGTKERKEFLKLYDEQRHESD